jgi:hypothetical protein
MRSHLALAIITALASSPALAQTNTSGSTSNSGASAIVNGDTIYNPSRIKQRISTTASAIAPGLTAAGVHSCAGSTSIGASVTGFNFGFGSTYEMIECNRRAYAATLAGMGQNAAALALVCNNAEVQVALNNTGVVCPQQRIAQAAARQQAAEQAAAADYVAQQAATANSAGRVIPINGGRQLYPMRGAQGNPCQSCTGPECNAWIKANYASLKAR